MIQDPDSSSDFKLVSSFSLYEETNQERFNGKVQYRTSIASWYLLNRPIRDRTIVKYNIFGKYHCLLTTFLSKTEIRRTTYIDARTKSIEFQTE